MGKLYWFSYRLGPLALAALEDWSGGACREVEEL